MKRRIFLIVLDGFGIGALPDATEYGDAGANTIQTVCASTPAIFHSLASMGLFQIDGVSLPAPKASQTAATFRLAEASKGKDTITGHFEIAGVVSKKPFPVFPNGFPKDFISKFEEAIGMRTLCNLPYSGIDVLNDYGKTHVDTGMPIVYTSQDSVFQIAAHEEAFGLERLYEICKIARSLLSGPYAVGRVIARPFTGKAPDFARTPNRHDYSLPAPKPTMLDLLKSAKKDVIAIGKINDIFSGRGITNALRTIDNADGLAKTLSFAEKDFDGLVFLNLVDFDMQYGHRNDTKGYAEALLAFDTWLPSLLSLLKEEDLLFITADHGCDPGFPGTDHTREYTPLLVYGNSVIPKNYGTRNSFSDIAKTIAEAFSLPNELDGTSFFSSITN